MTVSIPSSSSIEKAFLFCGSHGLPNSIDIVFNSVILRYDSSTIISNSFLSEFYAGVGGKGFVHVKDVTQYISSSQLIYQLTIPPQNSSNIRFTDFYLVVMYKDNSMSKTAVSIFINNQDINRFINYQISNINLVDTFSDIGLSVHGGYMCDTVIEPTLVHINSNFIGKIGGNDYNNNFICGGVVGSFFYENNSLYGLGDDIADSLMKGSDGLAIINSYISPSFNNFNILYEVQSNTSTNWLTNPVWTSTIVYTTPCDTFTTTTTTIQDTICLGDSVQLTATGGATYSWFGAFGGLSDTSIANPMASPPQTTTYIVTIKNDSGCVKTEHVKIWVNPLPKPDTIVVTNNVCGDSIGSITVGNIPNGNPPYSYMLTNLQTTNSNTQTTNTFNNLGTGIYEIQVTNANGCQWRDTVTITETNNAAANFTANPQSGVAPLDVTFNNVSNGANNFEWTVINSNGDTLAQHSTFNTQHFFTEGGTYEVCLIAYNNQPQCADTVCKTIFIDPNEEISLFIPNIFTPNGDNENDNFVIQLIGAAYLESLEVEVFNRWGQEVSSSRFDVQSLESAIPASSGMTELVVWNGTTTAGNKASEGTYFYVISYTTKIGETVTQKGTVSLLR